MTLKVGIKKTYIFTEISIKRKEYNVKTFIPRIFRIFPTFISYESIKDTVSACYTGLTTKNETSMKTVHNKYCTQ